MTALLLKATEKELNRQLNREREKNRNFEQRIKQVREENEKLRLAMPFDDTSLLSHKDTYDIPYGSHTKDRAETLKVWQFVDSLHDYCFILVLLHMYYV